MAKHGLRLRHCAGARAEHVEEREVGAGGLPLAGRKSRTLALQPGTLPPGARRGTVGRFAIAWPVGYGGDRGTHLQPCAAFCRRTARCRPPGPERCRHQPGAGFLRKRRADTKDWWPPPARRDVLVRLDGVAAAYRHAYQRFVVGNDRRRCRPQPGGDAEGSSGIAYDVITAMEISL